MPRVCTICTSKKRKQVDALIAKRIPVRNIEKLTHFGFLTIQRHKEHIRQALIKAQESQEVTNGTSVWHKLENMVEEAERQFKKNKGMLKATWFREMRGTIEMGIKLGLEAHREKQTFSDVTPAVLKLIEEAKE